MKRFALKLNLSPGVSSQQYSDQTAYNVPTGIMSIQNFSLLLPLLISLRRLKLIDKITSMIRFPVWHL